MDVKNNDPRPPYLQVVDDLRSSIAAGRYEPGERLPSGRELAKQYGVALMTMQKALNMLSDEGLVASYQGRGVFVRLPDGDAERHVPINLASLAKQLGDVQADVRQLEDRISKLERSPRRSTRRPS